MAADKALELFIAACAKPSMFVQGSSYSAVCAFMFGYDMALQGGALFGFREWLLTNCNGQWSNLAWWDLVRLRVSPDVDLRLPPSQADETHLLRELGESLTNFRTKQREAGVEGVYSAYAKWLFSLSDDDTEFLRARLR